MDEKETPVEIKPISKKAIRERQQTARRVYLDPSSPSVRSIIRVVVITMLLIYVAGSVWSIIASLTYLIFLLFLAIFFATSPESIFFFRAFKSALNFSHSF